MGCVNFPFANVKCLKFADDVTLIEPLSCYQSSSVTLDECASIFNDKGLIVNRSKCKMMSFCRSKLNHTDNNCAFNQVNSLKILAFIFSDSLKWDSHVSAMLKTASRRLYKITHFKKVDFFFLYVRL